MNKKTYIIVETAVLTVIGVLLEIFAAIIPLLQMPQGGRISLVLLPVIIASLRHGYLYGCISGFIIGIVVFMLDGFVIHWVSIIFDFFLAFTLVGLVAVFKKNAFNDVKKFIFAITLAFLIRYLMHSVSGVIFFSDFTDSNAWFYSFILYNLPYNFLSYLFMLLVGIMIYPYFPHIFTEKKEEA